jgi:hypothetical protein
MKKNQGFSKLKFLDISANEPLVKNLAAHHWLGVNKLHQQLILNLVRIIFIFATKRFSLVYLLLFFGTMSI